MTRRWSGPLVVGLAIFLLMGATIHKAGLIIGSTVVSGGTANVVLMTNSAGALANTSPTITCDGTNCTLASGRVIFGTAGTLAAPVIYTSGQTAAGLSFPSTGTVGISAAGISLTIAGGGGSWDIGGSGALVPSGTFDLGSSGSRVSQIFVGTSGINSTGDIVTTTRLHAAGGLHAQTGLTLGAHVVTIAAEGTAAVNNEILAGDRSAYLVDCNDGNGCVVRLGTNVTAGAVTNIVNISTNANTVTIDTVANVQHVFSLYTMSTNHAIGLMFTRNRSGGSSWVETSRNGRGT